MTSNRPRIDCTYKDCMRYGLYRPHDVICHRGQYIVADTHGNRVISIRPGNNSSEVICRGSKICGLSQPYNMEPYSIVALSDSKDDFLFTDRKNCCIVKISGGVCSVWNKNDHLFEHPTGIAVNTKREIFVADCKKHCIHLFDESGSYQTTFGKDKLNFPWFLAFNSTDQLHVSDDIYGIKIFEKRDGKSAYCLCNAINVDTDNARWTCRGINIDEDDNMFVTVRTVGSKGLFSYEKVTVYNSEYEPIANFGGYMQFAFIRGICFDYNNNFIVVVDGERNRLQRYTLYRDPDHRKTSPTSLLSPPSYSEAIAEDRRTATTPTDDTEHEDDKKDSGALSVTLPSHAASFSEPSGHVGEDGRTYYATTPTDEKMRKEDTDSAAHSTTSSMLPIPVSFSESLGEAERTCAHTTLLHSSMIAPVTRTGKSDGSDTPK